MGPRDVERVAGSDAAARVGRLSTCDSQSGGKVIASIDMTGIPVGVPIPNF